MKKYCLILLLLLVFGWSSRAQNFEWVKSFGGSSLNDGYSITVDDSGNVYTTGYFIGTGDFDPGTGIANLTSTGIQDVFVQKLDASGNFLWAKSFGSNSSDYGQSITVDASGNVYTTGYFNGTGDFDPGADTTNLTSSGGYDIFVQKIDGSGNFKWAKSFGGSLYEYGWSITVDASGNVYTTGHFEGTVDFDPGADTANLTSVGNNAVFVHKLSQCIITNTDVITACDSYTWPLNNTTYTSSTNTPTVTLANAASCDSVVMLDLTIKSVSNITTTLNGVTLSANNNNATYQWLDCNNNYSIISGETSQSFSPSINGNYAVQLTENGCIDTSVCVSILTIGIIENEFGNELLVSPNPTTGDFSINLGSVYKSAEISISEVNGKLIRSESIENKQVFNMFLKEPPGIYLITIQTGDKMAFIKLIKD
ncbi:MAG: SBBP repeat-containing protein [Flavobacteriales bacterium]|nr:SBBP repeat-containing protein [Flavobacteriales bacterium]